VADFGLSQLLADGAAGHDTNAMRGTPFWNAPEVLLREVRFKLNVVVAVVVGVD
jgi:serine/threonine protein kinase